MGDEAVEGECVGSTRFGRSTAVAAISLGVGFCYVGTQKDFCFGLFGSATRRGTDDSPTSAVAQAATLSTDPAFPGPAESAYWAGSSGVLGVGLGGGCIQLPPSRFNGFLTGTTSVPGCSRRMIDSLLCLPYGIFDSRFCFVSRGRSSLPNDPERNDTCRKTSDSHQPRPEFAHETLRTRKWISNRILA